MTRTDLQEEENIGKPRPKFLVVPLFAAVLAFLIFSTISSSLGLSRFSPDSWSYYELSLTMLGDSPYRFMTLRSYATEELSAAFPFGWPYVLSIAGIVLGQSPLNAPILNSLIAGGLPLSSGPPDLLARRFQGSSVHAATSP